MKYFTQIIIALFFQSCGILAQQKVLPTPSHYLLPKEQKAEIKAFVNDSLWLVFANCENTPVYKDKTCSIPKDNVLAMMQPMFVLKETEDAIQVVEILKADSLGNLKTGFKNYEGWVRKEDMVLNQIDFRSNWRKIRKTNSQNVMLLSHGNLYAIKRLLERMVTPDEYSMSESDYRAYLVYTWGEILVEILGLFPEHNETIDTLSLGELSQILTGWPAKEKFRGIKLEDVLDQDKFPPEMLYEYLIDWCITKGHIQSLYDGLNLLSGSFFEDHQYGFFFEYIYILTWGDTDGDEAVVDQLSNYFSKYNEVYNNYKAKFRLPINSEMASHNYWVDTRIFPHDYKQTYGEDYREIIFKKYLNSNNK